MNKELNCTNCSIEDFKAELCDCDNGFCKEFKSIGTQEDFFNAVMQRIRPQGEWIRTFDGNEWYWYCSNCKEQWYEDDLYMGGNKFPSYCPNCGAKMKEVEE